MLLEKLVPSIPMPDQWYGKLAPYEAVVVAGLLYHSGQRWDGQSEPAEVWESSPTIKAIAQGAGISATTVKKALAQLQSYGIVTVEPRWEEDGGRDSNLYRVHLYRPIQKDAQA